MAVLRFCAFCGASRVDEQANFCGSCGRSFSVGPQVVGPVATSGESGSPASPSQATALLTTARKRPLWAVLLLTAGTFSVYFFVHLGLMWAEMKRARQDPSMNPVGHAFAQFVPFYGLFRFHAHVRTLDEMLSSAGSPRSLSAGWATGAYILISIFSFVSGTAATPAWLIFPSFAAYAAFAAWRQDALNAYYDQISQGTIPERVHGFEWVVMVLGGVLLSLSVVGTFLPAS